VFAWRKSAAADLYNTQVASLESTHQNLCQQLDAELAQDSSSGSTAATIMCISSNMHRLLAIHQLFHVAIMHNLADQQLAHLCVRCFPRFPYMQDLLNALSKLRDTRGKGLNLPEVPDGVARVGGGISLPGASSYLDRQPLQKPNPVEPSALGKGRASDSSKLLQYGSGLLSSSVAGLIKEESKSQAEAEQGSEAAAAADQGAPRSPVVDVVKGSAKDWDVQGGGREEAGNSTPVRPDSSSAAPPASNQKGARSPGPAGGSSRMNSNSKGSKRPGSSTGTAAAAAYNGGSSTLNSKRNKPSAEEKWTKQQSRPSKDSAAGMDVDLEAVAAAAAAAGMPLDPAAAAALPVPLDTLPAQQRPSTANQQAGLPQQLMQQLAAALSTTGAPTDIMQMLATQPKLAAVLQQNPQLLGMLQEALVPQDQQHQQEPHDPWQQQQQQQQQQQSMHHATLPELLQAVAAGGAAALAALPAQQQQQQSYGGFGRPPSAEAAMQQQHQQQQWEAQHGAYGVGQAGGSRSTGLPALEVLPPSLMAKEAAGGSGALQALLKSVATLLQACSSVTEAATAAADAGHGEFVASAVSTAEAALGAALKSLQDVKLQGSSKAYHGGSAAVPPPAVSFGAVGLSAPPAQRMGLPGAGPSASRLQPPAGIPMPGPHSSQQMLPQSLSMVLSGMQLPLGADALPPHSGPSQLHRSSSRAAGYSTQPPVHNSHVRTQQKPLHQQEQQQQQPSTAAAFMQQLASLGENPAAIAQLLQVLQQQQPSAELSALLVQVVSSAAVQGAIPDLASLAAMFTQQQQQVPAAVKRNTSAAAAAAGAPAPRKKTPPPVYPPWQQGAKHADMYGGYEAATQQGLGAPAAACRAVPQAAAPPKLAPVSQPPAANSRDIMQYAPGYENPAAAAVAAAAAAVLSGPGTAAASDAAAAAAPATAAGAAARAGAEAKEDSPSAGSSTTITGQSGRQQNGTDTAADHTSQQQKHEQQPHGQQQKQEQQQLEGLARAAAAAMGSQLQGAGQAEAFISTVMQLLQGQGSADMASAGVNAVAGLLQAMTGPPTQQQPGVNPAPAATAATAPAMGQSPAAAATVVPPAAAAAMAAAKRPLGAAAGPKPVGALATGAAGGGGGGVSGHVQQASPDLREADAMSALEMLASAAVHSQHQHEGAARKKVGTRER